MNRVERLTPINSLGMDVIRVLAAWMVLLGHAGAYFGLYSFGFPIQNMGVVLLFIISGFFTLYSIALKVNNPENIISCKGGVSQYSFKVFFIERFSRICVVYYPALVVVLLIDMIHIFFDSGGYAFHDAFNVKTFIGNILFLQDFPFLEKVFTSFGSDRPLWTLGVEWWIYMAFGFTILVALRKIKSRQLRGVHIIVLVLFAISPIAHLIGGRGNGITFTWLLGCACLLAYDRWKTRVPRFVLLVAAAVAVLLAVLYANYKGDVYYWPFILLLAFAIFFFLSFGRDAQNDTPKAIKKVVKFFSGYSYSLFAIHYPVVDLFARWDNIPLDSSFHRYIAALIVSNIIAIAMGQLFEKRSRILGDFLKSKFVGRD